VVNNKIKTIIIDARSQFPQYIVTSYQMNKIMMIIDVSQIPMDIYLNANSISSIL